MGYSIAAEAVRRGHDVVLVSGPVALAPPDGVEFVSVTTAAEMADACRRYWPSCDAAIMTAAVCDYRPARRLSRKLKKSDRPRLIKLVPTEDIARSLGSSKGPGQILVGFAMEDHDGRRNARKKLKQKNCDVIVLNGPQNIGADRAEVEVLVAGQAWQKWGPASKQQIAGRLVRLVERLGKKRTR